MFVEVVSPEESCFSGDATMVISRTPNGEIGILEGHEQTVATLLPGGLTIEHDNTRTSFAISGGYAVEDCSGVCDGDAAYDDCNVCDGDNSSCTGCLDEDALNYNPDAILDCEGCCVYNEPGFPGHCCGNCCQSSNAKIGRASCRERV